METLIVLEETTVDSIYASSFLLLVKYIVCWSPLGAVCGWARDQTG